MRIAPKVEPSWPPLAWLANCSKGDDTVRLHHGVQVEIRDEWFCEAVWDGDFGSGEFDATDLVFGTGGRLHDGAIQFISSGSTVDRLQYLEQDGDLFVSNSLACLLTFTDGAPDLSGTDYPELFRSVTKGLDDHVRSLPTSVGSVQLLYFRNLRWDGRTAGECEKPDPGRDFSTFEKYKGFMSSALERIATNMRDSRRVHRYEWIAALSSGYDSTTATVLASEVGLSQVFSFRNARGGQQDHGERVAKHLGIPITLIERTAFRDRPCAEVPYFAATGVGVDAIFSGASHLLKGRVLISGFHGDKMWDKHTKALGRNIVRGDASGLSFTDHRLMLGTVHLPLPFMGVREIAQVVKLSNSAEMRPWDVPGDYSRPVCRRIVEDAGIARDWFGQKKMAATSLFRQGESRPGADTEQAFHRWLSVVARERGRAGKDAVVNAPGRGTVFIRDRFHVVSPILGLLRRILPATLARRLERAEVSWQRALNRKVNPVSLLFPFGIDEMRAVYGSSAGAQGRARARGKSTPT